MNIQVINDHLRSVTSIAFDIKTHTLFSASFDKSIRVYRSNFDPKHLYFTSISIINDAHDDYIFSLCYDEKNKHLYSGSKDKTIKVWKQKMK